MRRWTIGSAVLAVFVAHGVLSARAGEVISGRVIVIDGDTLRIGGTVIGLAGIAAPGLGQTCEGKTGAAPCGKLAAKALADHIGAAVARCATTGPDHSHRVLATCALGGEDLNGWMVSSGLAVSERFSDRTYFAHETAAWAKRRGLWAGVFEDPTGRPRADYSLADKLPEPEESKPPESDATLRLSRLAK